MIIEVIMWWKFPKPFKAGILHPSILKVMVIPDNILKNLLYPKYVAQIYAFIHN
jgi:hypothetical protein